MKVHRHFFQLRSSYETIAEMTVACSPASRNGKMSFFVILLFHVRISYVYRESHYYWLHLVGHEKFNFFHVHNRHDAFAGQPSLLTGQKTFVSKSFNENLKNVSVICIVMSCVEFRTVSPTGGSSCLNSQTLMLVHSSFCENLMDCS